MTFCDFTTFFSFLTQETFVFEICYFNRPYAYHAIEETEVPRRLGSIGLRVKAVVRNVPVAHVCASQTSASKAMALTPKGAPTWRRDDVNAYMKGL